MIYLFLWHSVPVNFITFFFTSSMFCSLPSECFFLWSFFSLSLSLPLLLFSEWLLFHVGCPCWKNQSNVVFTLKSHCFHDYKKCKPLLVSDSFSISVSVFFLPFMSKVLGSQNTFLLEAVEVKAWKWNISSLKLCCIDANVTDAQFSSNTWYCVVRQLARTKNTRQMIANRNIKHFNNWK